MNRPNDAKRKQRREKAIDDGWQTVRGTLVLTRLANACWLKRSDQSLANDLWAVVDGGGAITVNYDRDGEPAEWAWVFAHLLLHLGLGHTEEEQLAEAEAYAKDGRIDPVYAAACCVTVNRFAEVVRVGRSLSWLPVLPGADEIELTHRWRLEGAPEQFYGCGTGGSRPCLVPAPPPQYPTQPVKQPWAELFARGLSDAANNAMEQAAESRGQVVQGRALRQWDRALSWFVSSYPLLGAVAARFTLVADPEIACAWDIALAAVSAEHGEIYVNPHATLTGEEWRFVLAHEMLHAALGHDRRALGRDPYLWNVACDYVINGWLVAMAVGHLPDGCLYDRQLTGLSAESVYDTLSTDLRRARKLLTMGGRSAGDVLGDWLSEPEAASRRSSRRETPKPLPWQVGDRTHGVDLDDFYRRSLTQGLEYHRSQNRGDMPFGLEEEIRALDHPPLPWDAQLARWFDEHFRAEEPSRTYARASRRQAATPDIPRPGLRRPDELTVRRTFGVVLDTSGSMPVKLLGKALGAIASYALAREVPAARVVFCDAVAYDAGYLSVEDIAGKVKIRGRGGTVLQPGVNLLQNADDFPDDGPILVITDAECDVVRVRREHAFLVPVGARLPFTAKGPVFRVG